jgi:hypothetical protein
MNGTNADATILIRIALAWLSYARRHPGDVEAVASAAKALELALDDPAAGEGRRILTPREPAA